MNVMVVAQWVAAVVIWWLKSRGYGLKGTIIICVSFNVSHSSMISVIIIIIKVGCNAFHCQCPNILSDSSSVGLKIMPPMKGTKV